MPTDYPQADEPVNEQDQPKPGYYAIIPASVRYCRALAPAAKLLFGELVALTSTSGYCYAQNPYFMRLYDVDRRTIMRWLAALAEQGFISIEHDQATNERRIYVLAMLPGGEVGQKRPTSRAKMSHPQGKNAPQSITESNTKSIKATLNVADARFKGPGPVPASVLEGKGSASPPDRLTRKRALVDAAIAATGDTKSVLRFRQLLDIADDAACPDVWPLALDALKVAQSASTGLVERPGAYFCSVVVSLLSERQVYVPVASAKERRAVRSQISASLALGSEASE